MAQNIGPALTTTVDGSGNSGGPLPENMDIDLTEQANDEAHPLHIFCRHGFLAQAQQLVEQAHVPVDILRASSNTTPLSVCKSRPFLATCLHTM